MHGGDGLTAHDIASRGGGMGSSVIRLSASDLGIGAYRVSGFRVRVQGSEVRAFWLMNRELQ